MGAGILVNPLPSGLRIEIEQRWADLYLYLTNGYNDMTWQYDRIRIYLKFKVMYIEDITAYYLQ